MAYGYGGGFAISERLFEFVGVALAIVILGIVLGVPALVNNSVNGTITIPQSILNANDTIGNLAGTSIVLAGVVILIAILIGLVAYMRYMGGGMF